MSVGAAANGGPAAADRPFMNLRFGTDGIRGRAFDELTELGVEALGAAAAVVFAPERFYVGRDTRESGPVLARALHAGLASAKTMH